VNRVCALFDGLRALLGLGLILVHLCAARAPAALPVAGAGEGRFLSNARQLIFEGKRSGEGYFSPDGRALIFQSERELGNPFYQIYTLDLETGETRRLSPGVGKTTCAFFRPGADEVLFASTHLDPESKARQQAEIELRASGRQRRYAWDYDEHMDIFAARRDGSMLRRLTASLGYDAEGSYSPDGRRIVFCSLRDAYPTNKLSAAELKRLETDPAWFGEIYLMNADGSDPRRLTHSPGYDGGPFFSPDGQWIVYRAYHPATPEDKKEYLRLLRENLFHPTTLELWVMRADGSRKRQITSKGAASFAPYFFPGGKRIVFASNLGATTGMGNFELWAVNLDGGGLERITYSDGFDGFPMFSPDGHKLVWSSQRNAREKHEINVFLADWSD
jgi:Tol biopolymer transport system component